MYYKMIVRYLPIKKNQQKYKKLWSSNLHVVIFVLLFVLHGSHKQQQQQQQQHIATASDEQATVLAWPELTAETFDMRGAETDLAP